MEHDWEDFPPKYNEGAEKFYYRRTPDSITGPDQICIDSGFETNYKGQVGWAVVPNIVSVEQMTQNSQTTVTGITKTGTATLIAHEGYPE